MFTRLLNYDRTQQCHVVYNRCGYCHACYRSRR